MKLPVSPSGRRYGFIKSSTDTRDLWIASAPILKDSTPSSVSLEAWTGPVFDQGEEGSCTANAGCGNFEYLLRRFKKNTTILSRSFLYYMARKLDNSLSEGDCGSTGRSVCKAMNQFGVCADSDMPYEAGDFELEPSEEQLGLAKQTLSGAYHALKNLADIKSCLSSDYPALMGFSVYESFESRETSSTGVMPVPDKRHEQLLGGHEVLIIGYDDSRSALKVRNSWGTGWGDRGNFWFPYQCVSDQDVFLEGWMQHLSKPWVPHTR